MTRTRPQANQTNTSTLATTTTQYDVMGRPLSFTYSDGTPQRSFIYDQTTAFGSSNINLGPTKGRLTRELSSAGNGTGEAISYDVMGRVTGLFACRPSTCGSSADGMLYSYDLAGNLLTSTDGNSVTTTYTYSVANQLQTATSSRSDAQDPSSLLSSVQNGPFGPLNYHLGNGINAVNSYDGLGRLNGRWVCAGNTTSANCSGGTQLDGSTATWKGVRATAVTDTYANQAYSYGYDEFNRLTSTSVGGSTTYSYAYDRWGNRTSQTPGPSATFNGSNQTTGFSYDAAGNLMKDAAGNSYSYDAEGNVTQVTGTSVGTVKYTYDGLNQRVRVDKGSSYQEYDFNQQGQRVSIWNGTTNLQGQYYLNGQTAAYYTGGSIHFQHKDWLGTERIRTTSSGSLEGRFMQLAFGDGYQVTSGTDTDDAHYASLDYDAPMQTSHAQFRELDTTHGHWMSPDPYDGSYDISNPQSLNRYGYVLNLPVSLADPAGLMAPDCYTTNFYVDGSFDSSETICLLGGGGGGGGGGGASAGSGGGGGSLARLAALARCASKTANNVSLAALLPSGTPSIVSNILGNDFSSISNFITGPSRGGALVSISQGKGLNAGLQAAGAIQYTADRFILGTNGAGATYAIHLIPGTISNSAAGKLTSSLLGTASSIKLAYDAATYVGALAVCYANQE